MTWPVDGGEMGERIRRHDWAATSLGALESWPQSLRTAVDLMLGAAQPVLISWGDEQLILFNNGYLPILGEKQAWALGTPFAKVWGEIWEEYRPFMDGVMAGQAYFFRDRRVELAGRQHGWFTFSFTPLRDESGGVRGLFNVATETTEKVLADKALIDSMDEGFAIFDTVFDDQGRPCDFRWILTNAAFESQTGQTDTVGRTLKEVLPALEAVWLDTFSRVVSTGQGTRFTQESASEGRWYDCYAFRYGAADSTRLGLLFRDVTEARRAEQALLDASRRKDEFLAMLAHELRNPLAPIAAGADLLKMVSNDADRVKKTSEVIARQVRHMTGLVDDLLDVSRVTRGQVRLDLSDLDVHRVVLDAIEQVRPLLQARGHQLTLNASTQPATVRGDSKRLVQTFANLLTNAAKYTPQGGRVGIAIEVAGDSVVVSVSDNGNGMSPGLLSQCFELFVQGERTTERSAGGLGIGLALVRSIVELHEGSLRAESDGIGQGSRFTVTLPRVAAASQDAAHPQQPAERMRETASRLKVLVVDDNEDAAGMLAMLIDALGHEVLIEHHPRTALERLGQQAPDVCFLDIGLPDMDGYELARTIRTRFGDARPTLVAVTGYGQPQDREKALAAGFDEHFAKPVSGAKLAELLSAA
jgi:signal transduction histidine kinase